jgi:hypothetical protein
MSKFEVGERVAIYGGEVWFKENTYYNGAKGTVEEVMAEPGVYLVVKLDDCGEHRKKPLMVQVHPKQCRRLKKWERRRYWIKQVPRLNNYRYWETLVSDDPGCLEQPDFGEAVEVEVVRKRK